MGQAKKVEQKRIEDEQAAWDAVCRSKAFVCLRCGEVPLKEEREIYFETKLCGYCAHMSERMKDDET
jgi:hypothetical protein